MIEAFTISKTAKRIDRTEQQIARDIRKGKIRAERLGRDWLIAVEEVSRLEALYPLEAM